MTLSERFWAKVDASGDCWMWTAGACKGYGMFRGEHRVMLAHRMAWELTQGPVPEGLELDHLCRVPLCVNPDHLQPVTHAENMRRGATIVGIHTASRHWDQRRRKAA